MSEIVQVPLFHKVEQGRESNPVFVVIPDNEQARMMYGQFGFSKRDLECYSVIQQALLPFQSLGMDWNTSTKGNETDGLPEMEGRGIHLDVPRGGLNLAPLHERPIIIPEKYSIYVKGQDLLSNGLIGTPKTWPTLEFMDAYAGQPQESQRVMFRLSMKESLTGYYNWLIAMQYYKQTHPEESFEDIVAKGIPVYFPPYFNADMSRRIREQRDSHHNNIEISQQTEQDIAQGHATEVELLPGSTRLQRISNLDEKAFMQIVENPTEVETFGRHLRSLIVNFGMIYEFSSAHIQQYMQGWRSALLPFADAADWEFLPLCEKCKRKNAIYTRLNMMQKGWEEKLIVNQNPRGNIDAMLQRRFSFCKGLLPPGYPDTSIKSLVLISHILGNDIAERTVSAVLADELPESPTVDIQDEITAFQDQFVPRNFHISIEKMLDRRKNDMENNSYSQFDGDSSPFFMRYIREHLGDLDRTPLGEFCQFVHESTFSDRRTYLIVIESIKKSQNLENLLDLLRHYRSLIQVAVQRYNKMEEMVINS